MRLFGFEISLRRKSSISALGDTDGALSALNAGRGWWGAVRESFAGAWQANVQIEPVGGLLSFGAIYACITRIANDIAKLEPELLVEGDDGIEVYAPDTSPFWAVLRRPNSFQNRIQFFAFWLTCKLTFGNAYALKVRENARGIVRSLYLLDPRRVTPMVAPDGQVFYSLGGDTLARIPTGMMVPASEIIHDRMCTLWHPLVGISPLYACAMSGTQGLKIQQNSATFFQNMSRPSGMLTAPGTISDETATRLKTEWEKNYSAANLGRLAVLGDGLTYAAMTIPAETAQLVEQLGWTVEDVARCFAMPLYKINSGPMPTNNNVEALESQYYTGCLQINIESIELCLTEGLEVPTGYCVEFNLEGLLRMDSTAQAEVLKVLTGASIMAPNEARAKRRLPPVPGGKYPMIQQQNYSLEAIAKRDASADPFGKAAPPAPTPAPVEADPPPAKDVAVDQIAAMLRRFEDAAAERHDAAAAQVKKLLDAASQSSDDLLRIKQEADASVQRLADLAAAAQAEKDAAERDSLDMEALGKSVADLLDALELA